MDAETVRIKLMPNPLAKDAKAIIDLAIGFDDENSYLKTMDGLPLFTSARRRTCRGHWITKSGEKSVDVWQDNGGMSNNFASRTSTE